MKVNLIPETNLPYVDIPYLAAALKVKKKLLKRTLEQ